MKKILFIITAAAVILSMAGCSKKDTGAKKSNLPEEYMQAVEAEPFEKLYVQPGYTNDHRIIKDENIIYNNSECIIVGMVTDTFTDGQPLYVDLDGKKVESAKGVTLSGKYTLQNIKVLEVIKGTVEGDTISFANECTIEKDVNKKDYIDGLIEGKVIPKKNAKYIFYLNRHTASDKVFYTSFNHNGLISIDGLDEKALPDNIEEDVYHTAQHRYEALFEMYDRTGSFTPHNH